MRILIITNLYPPHVLGGYEIGCRSVAAGLHARGHHVEVLAGHAPIASYDDPYWVHRVLDVRGFDAAAPCHTKELVDVGVMSAQLRNMLTPLRCSAISAGSAPTLFMYGIRWALAAWPCSICSS